MSAIAFAILAEWARGCAHSAKDNNWGFVYGVWSLTFAIFAAVLAMKGVFK